MGLHGLGLTYLSSPFHNQLGKKNIFSVNNYPPHTIGPMSHVCMKKLFICQKGFLSFALLIFIIRHKVQLTLMYVDYQRKEKAKTRARLDELKMTRVIHQEKLPAIIKFKPQTFVPPPWNIPTQQLGLSDSLTRNNHPQGFKFFAKATNPFHSKKPIFFSFYSSPLYPTTFALATPTGAAADVAAIADALALSSPCSEFIHT